MSSFIIVSVLASLLCSLCVADDPNRLPTKCETCKYLANELSESLLEHSSNEFILTDYNLDNRLNKKNPKKYLDSELRIIEVFEEVCNKILTYSVHAERHGSLRYAKGQSQTMKTLHGLRNRGVKVELGIPEDAWDMPSVEITNLKKYCDTMVETYEEDIEDWYFKYKDQMSLTDFLCDQRILVGDDKSCLKEEFVPENEQDDAKPSNDKKDAKPSRSKGDASNTSTDTEKAEL